MPLQTAFCSLERYFAKEKKASGEEYEDVTPVTWPLNVKQNIIEDWKVKFSEIFK